MTETELYVITFGIAVGAGIATSDFFFFEWLIHFALSPVFTGKLKKMTK